MRNYERVSGPLLEEVLEANRRQTDLAELSENMLWDDIGFVAGEEYRLQLYACLGYTIAGGRSTSPEIGNLLCPFINLCKMLKTCFFNFFNVVSV